MITEQQREYMKAYRANPKNKARRRDNDKRRYRNDPLHRAEILRRCAEFAKTPAGKESAKRAMAKYASENKQRAVARYTVSNAVQYGKLPRASSLTCTRCGQPAKEYHHHNGYEPEHALDVAPVCKSCHYAIHSDISPLPIAVNTDLML